VRELARSEGRPTPSMDDAFIAVVEQARERNGAAAAAA
jgi:hypothetical protein